MKDFISVNTIANHLAISPEFIRKMLRSGELPGIKLGRTWRIEVEEAYRVFGDRGPLQNA